MRKYREFAVWNKYLKVIVGTYEICVIQKEVWYNYLW